MFRRIALISVLSAAMIGVAVGGAAASSRETFRASNPHTFPARGAKPGGAGASPLLVYHGGAVRQPTTATHVIFWGTSWPGYTGDKISGIDAFYGGVGGTSYAGTNTEYTDSTGTHVSSTVTYAGHAIDSSRAPTRAPSTGTVAAEVGKVFTTTTAGDYYAVYVDTKRGHAGYCAWHSSGTINGKLVQFAFFFNLDGDPGCDPGSALDSKTNVSQGLAALGNVSGHELSEMLTDPQLNAWYDGSGAENADKCAWTFSGNALSFGGNKWIIQGNWSNNAYGGNTGYVNYGTATVVRGCIDGS
jgi:hypothetical protein